MRTRTRRRIVTLVLACSCVAGWWAGSLAAATPEARPPPTELWERFPLDPAPEPGTVTPPPPLPDRVPPEPEPESRPPPGSAGKGSFGGLELALIAGGLVLAGSAVAVVARRRGRPHTPVLPALDCDSVLGQLAGWQGGSIRLPEVIMFEERGADASGATGRVDIGARVNEILGAAEDAADRHRSEALEAAAAIRTEAELDAAAIAEEAQRDRARLQSEADAEARETRNAGDVYATQRRRQADEEAGKLLAEAEQQARATREAAEAMANKLENEARARTHELSERVRELETRLGRVPAALRSTAAQLEEVLANGRPSGSLLEALDVDRHKVPGPQ